MKNAPADTNRDEEILQLQESIQFLRRSQDQLTKAINVAKIGFYDWDIVKNIVSYSEQMKEDWGIKESGRLEDALERIHPEDRDSIHEQITQALLKRQHFSAEYRVVRPNKTTIWIEAQGEVNYDENGEPIRFFGTSVNISDRKSTEEKLKRASGILNSIMANSVDVIYVKDRFSRMVYCNPITLKLTQKTEEELYGKNDLDFLGPDNGGEEILASDERIMRSGQGETVEEAIKWPGSEKRIYMSSKEVLRDQKDRVIGLIGISRDITEIKKTQSALEAALLAKDELMSVSSHELRTPISGLKLQLQLAKRAIDQKKPDAFSPERITRLVEQGNRQLDRLSRLIDDMFDYSRIQTGKLPIAQESVDLSKVVLETSERLQSHLEANGCELSWNIADGITICGDEGRLEQVMTNFLTNAARYGDGKPVKIKLTCSSADTALLQVADQGRGIAAEDQKRIFEKFERAVNSCELSGLGLGLYITQEIVKAHGGKVWVDSTVGGGATFFAEFPLEKGKI